MIREAMADEASLIYHIEQSCFEGDKMSLRSIKRFIAHPHDRLWVAVEDGVLAGYMISFIHPRSKLARHYSMAILPEFRGRGLARAFMEHADAECAKRKAGAKLEVRTDNAPIIHLHSSRGYTERSRIPSYYEDGCDAIEMVKFYAC